MPTIRGAWPRKRPLPFIDTVYVESVAEGAEEAVIDELIQQQGVDVVLTTSFGFMNGTYSAALRYPGRPLRARVGLHKSAEHDDPTWPTSIRSTI